MARAAWLNHVPIPPENIHSVSVEHGDPPAVAAAYEQEIRAVFGLAPGELPRFDLVLLGLGEDGHTASLFPGTPALQERERLVVACFVDRLNVWRITMTAPAINAAAHIVFLVSGQSKAQVLREVLSSQYQPERLPAQLISPINGTLIWLVDSAAAGSHSYAGNGGAS
ncbi:MAG: hypothetical protein KatS3mg057_2840 [Herpetosiphonaceae bacterium]|nr:MAG: hypothetical protein KatS3mg057_2840 [Herpetosiphonaceae bacterium]